MLQSCTDGMPNECTGGDLALFGTKEGTEKAAEIARLTAENARLSSEIDRLTERIKALEIEHAKAHQRADDAVRALEAASSDFDKRRKKFENAYNRVKKQRDKLRFHKRDSL